MILSVCFNVFCSFHPTVYDNSHLRKAVYYAQRFQCFRARRPLPRGPVREK